METGANHGRRGHKGARSRASPLNSLIFLKTPRNTGESEGRRQPPTTGSSPGTDRPLHRSHHRSWRHKRRQCAFAVLGGGWKSAWTTTGTRHDPTSTLSGWARPGEGVRPGVEHTLEVNRPQVPPSLCDQRPHPEGEGIQRSGVCRASSEADHDRGVVTPDQHQGLGPWTRPDSHQG